MNTRKMKRERFRVGDLVAWTSQSAGVQRTKVGTVVQVVPARCDPEGVRNPGCSRDHESYVVRVKWRGLYWPRVLALSAAIAVTGVAEPTP